MCVREMTSWVVMHSLLLAVQVDHRAAYDAALAAEADQKWEQAVRLHEEAARLGSPHAMARLGYFLQSGVGTTKDAARGVDLYRKGAEGGSIEGRFLLAMAYYRGIGVAQDLVQARAWFHKAAADAHQRAQLMLAVMLVKGEGGAKNEYSARTWAAKAAAGPDEKVGREAESMRQELARNLEDGGLAAATFLAVLTVIVLGVALLGSGDGSAFAGTSVQWPVLTLEADRAKRRRDCLAAANRMTHTLQQKLSAESMCHAY